jgi:hypothetical protein
LLKRKRGRAERCQSRRAEHGGYGDGGGGKRPIGPSLSARVAASMSTGWSRVVRRQGRGESEAGAAVMAYDADGLRGGARDWRGLGCCARLLLGVGEVEWRWMGKEPVLFVALRRVWPRPERHLPASAIRRRPRGGHGLRTVGAAAFERERGERGRGLGPVGRPGGRRWEFPNKNSFPFLFLK